MNPSQSAGSDNGAVGGSRASKKRRVTFGADEVEQQQAAAGVENFGGDAGGAAVSSALLTNEQVDQYLPHIVRSDLNALIRRHLVQGIPLTLADLAAARKYVPYKRSCQIIPTCREGWNGLDENLMRDILFRLNLREKVICTSMVCKAWSELKNKTPGLFVDLDCPSGPGTALQMARFMKWIPLGDAQLVTNLRLATNESDSSMRADDVLRQLSEWKHPALDKFPDSDDEEGHENWDKINRTSLSHIEKLYLVGPKIGDDTFFEAKYLGLGPSLVSFGVDNITSTRAQGMHRHGSLEKALKQFTVLKVLKMPSSIVSSAGLAQTLAGIGPRNQLQTSLRVLDLTKTTTNVPIGEEADNIHWDDVAVIGRFCPKLEILRIPMVTASDGDEDFASIVALPSLRTFSLGRILPNNSDEVYAPSEVIRIILTWLLNAMPIVEDFSFCHGECEGLERELLPGLGHNGISNFPNSLRKLHLRDLNIEPSALASSSIDMGTIESITMENCGSNQVDALKIFCRRYHDRGDGTAAMPSLGVSGDSAFMIRGPASFPADVVEIDE